MRLDYRKVCMLFKLGPLLSRKRAVWGAFLILFLSTFFYLENIVVSENGSTYPLQ
jgi:hypothetical protein